MILVLKTSEPEAYAGLIKGDSVIDEVKWQAHHALADTILVKTDELLKQNDITSGDLEGIIVFQGPGSFTGLRIGISVANALANGLQIPEVGSMGDDWVAKGLARLANQQKIVPVLPMYGAPVNTTLPKK